MNELEFVKNALSEDLGRGDLFSNIATDKEVSAKIIAKDSGILSGKKYALVLLGLVNVDCKFYFDDGSAFKKGDVLVKIYGAYLDILKIERTLLNILQHSSGIATNTSLYVKILQENSLNTTLLDTRKTRPNLRVFEKYSVLNGGGKNHRFGLDDSLMLKDTHLAHIYDLKAFIKMARAKIPWTSKIEVECDNLESSKIAMQSGADIVMCDNMEVGLIKEVVDFRNNNFSSVLLEASGNISKENLLSYAKSGVDAISVGSLIHHAVWVDLSLKIDS